MSDERTPNIPLLRKAVEWVEEQDKLPEIDSQWNQSSWVKSALSKGLDLLYLDAEERYFSGIDGDQRYNMAQQVAAHCGTAYCVAGYVGQLLEPKYEKSIEPNGLPHVSEFARNALGLDEVQAENLFASHNDAEDVRYFAEQIAGEKL